MMTWKVVPLKVSCAKITRKSEVNLRSFFLQRQQRRICLHWKVRRMMLQEWRKLTKECGPKKLDSEQLMFFV